VLCNNKFRELYADVADVFQPGATFAEILNAAAERGTITGTEGGLDAWIGQRMASHRNPAGPIEYQVRDGRWVQLNHYRLTPVG
jgi:hypothetical protein